jgi:purine-nucleoside phosphorylase
MSYHIAAKPGEIAETVIISGDPLRVKHMAGKLLHNATCFNEIRAMYGYTGKYNGNRVSMLGTGMGIPTTALFVHELVMNHGVKRIIRAGTLGALQPHLHIGDLVVALSASTDSALPRHTFGDMYYAPTATYALLEKAAAACRKTGTRHHIGQLFSTDQFYGDAARWQKWIDHGILGVEMETSVLYTLAAKYNIEALTVCTVSDHLITHKSSPPEVREKQFEGMFKLVLEIA